MAKTKKVKRKKATQAAKKANSALYDFYQFGCEVLKEEQDKKNPDFLEHIHEETGRTHNDIYKARSFAKLCQSELDLEWLCQLGSKKGKPLRGGHIHRLLRFWLNAINSIKKNCL